MPSVLVKRYIFDYNELLKILTEVPYSKQIIINDFDNNLEFVIIYDSINDKFILETTESTLVFDSAKTLVEYLKRNFTFTFLYAKIFHICDFDCNDETIKRLYNYLLKDRDNLSVKIVRFKQIDYAFV